MILNLIIFVKIHFKPDMALHELVLFISYLFGQIFSVIMAVELIRHKKLLDNIIQLHEDADLAMQQLGIHFDYRFAIVFTIFVVGLAYINWIFLIIFYGFMKSESIYDSSNIIIASFNLIMLLATSLILYGGNIFICGVRFIALNKFFENILSEFDDDDIIIDNRWATINSAEITAKLQLISDIHMKHHEITKSTMTFFSIFIFIFIHFVIVLNAMELYFQLFKKIVIIDLLCMDITGIVASIFLSICGEILKRQAKNTLTLMADMCMCYFDPAVISIRSAILLQASHEEFEPVSGGAVPINTSMLIFIVEASIAVVVFFIQFNV